jgi:hypothetical protein
MPCQREHNQVCDCRIYTMDDYSVGTTRESSNNPQSMTSFDFLVLPIVYYVFHYAFSQDLFNIGQIADQHEKVDK